MLSNGTIDGFILSISKEAQKRKQFDHFISIVNEGTPMVMFDRIADEVNCDKVIVDDFDSAINATNHLIDTGCKNIAMFSTINQSSVSNLRSRGFYKAFEQKGLKVNEDLIILTDNVEEFDAKINDFFDKNRIDGVFALNEHTAASTIKIGLRKGLKIPEELSVIGFADGVWSRRMTPSLSTVSQHGPEIGEVAAKLLINKLESKDEIYTFSTTTIKTELRQRDSTKKLF